MSPGDAHRPAVAGAGGVGDLSEVSCRVCAPLVEQVCASRNSLDALVEGLPFSVDALRRTSNRIRWDDFTVLIERAVELLGGVDRLEEIAEDIVAKAGIISALATNFVDVRPIYQLGATWYGPLLFSSTRATYEELSDGKIRQIIEILPSYRHSEVFFRVVKAGLRCAPSVLGQRSAEVEMEIHPRRAIYTITPPPPLTPQERVEAWYTKKSSIRDAVEELVVQNTELQESFDRERVANEQLGEKSHRLETVNRMGRELARHVDATDLAESVVALLSGEFSFRGIALFVMPPEGDELEVARREGKTSGDPTERHILTVANRCVGRLDLWEPEVSQGRSDPGLLQELLPWIALALGNVRAFESLSRQTRRLEEEIARRERVEEELQHAQKMEALGNLAGEVAHDFNNLLTAINTYAELACRELEPVHPARHGLTEIIGVVDRGADLARQILTFSRKQVLRLDRVDLNSLILGIAEMLRRLVGEKIEIVINPAEDLGLVIADESRLVQGIVNLVLNSRDAMPDGGTITIETSNVREGDVDSLPDAPRQRYVRIEVRDTGIGMDPETRSRVFEPFFTTKLRGEGTGLGLATLYGMITQSGGTVGVQSEPGKGASFSIHLPRIDAGLDFADPEDRGDLRA